MFKFPGSGNPFSFIGLLFRALFAAAMPLMVSGSESNATTETATTNIDQRMQQESGAIGISSSGSSTATINMLDGGAIKEAFGLGSEALENVTKFATGALSAAQYTAEGAMEGAMKSYESANKEVAKAYEDAKVGNRSMYMVGALAVGAVLLVVVLQRRRAA